MLTQFLQAGKIVNTHGIKGEVRIYPLCDSADFLLDFKRFYVDGKEMRVLSSRIHKNLALIRFEGIDTMEQAQPFVGKELNILREDADLDEGQYFIEDLIGMQVLDIDNGKEYGRLTNIIQTGANDVFEVKGEKTYLVPKIDSVVLKIDPDEGQILIRPLKGLFDE